MTLAKFVCLVLAFSIARAQSDSTIPSDYDEELEDSSSHFPKFISKSITIQAKEGETVTFPCDVDDLGPFSIVWKKGKTHIFADSIRLMSDKNFVRMENNSLQIRRLRANYSGEYICVISHTPPMELTHYLTVLVRPRVHILPKNSVVIKQGHNVDVSCNSTGSPAPTVSWKRLDGEGAGTIQSGPVLKIHSVDRMDAGTYECKAENGVGEPATAVLRVQVMYAPEIELKANWVHSGIGRTTDLECTVYAEPPAHVTWHRDDGRTDEHFKTKSHDKAHYLQIRKVTKNDFGKYTCTATNSIATSSATIEVSGLASPVHFKSDSSGNKPDRFILTWETNSYSKVIEYLLKFKVQEIESSGSPQVWTEVTIPAESQTGVLHTQTYEVTDLKSATTYDAVITARNEFGWNSPSDTFSFSTEGKAVVPPLLEDSSVMSAEQAHPHPQQADDSSDADTPKKVRVFSLLTVIILSFFF